MLGFDEAQMKRWDAATPAKEFTSTVYDGLSRATARKLWKQVWEYVDLGGLFTNHKDVPYFDALFDDLKAKLPPADDQERVLFRAHLMENDELEEYRQRKFIWQTSRRYMSWSRDVGGCIQSVGFVHRMTKQHIAVLIRLIKPEDMVVDVRALGLRAQAKDGGIFGKHLWRRENEVIVQHDEPLLISHEHVCIIPHPSIIMDGFQQGRWIKKLQGGGWL